MSKFIPINVHSHYSLLCALPKIPDLVEHAKKNGLPALALTDNGNLYGAIEFYKECKKQGIKPILGMHAYMAFRQASDRQAGIDNRRQRLILLAKNDEGYQNLIQLTTLAYLDGFYYRPRIDFSMLEKYNKGLFAIAPAFNSDIQHFLATGNNEALDERVILYQKLFGKDGFLFEISRHPEISGHEASLQALIALARKKNVPLIASNEVYYLYPEDRKARETLMLVSTQGEAGERNSEDGEFSFLPDDEVSARFKDLPEAISENERVAGQCNLELKLGRWIFPDYQTKAGKSHDEELRELVENGAKQRGVIITPKISERIEYELKIIKDKGYAPYFLVVGDLMRYAHEHGILTTIRGSVAGSLVTFLASITNVDPIKYQLPFERFLNSERPSAPDIDMDFADNRRDEMIEYAKKKYGETKVAQVGTFGTMMARGSVRDIARALGFEYGIGDRIAKLIPFGSQGFPMSIDRAMELVPELAKLYRENPSIKQIIDIAKKIEGCARHISVHAAGVVIAPKPLVLYTPLQRDPKGGKLITQYDMYSITDEYGGVGLLKFDFLGIKNLAILSDAVALAKKLEGADIDIENVPVEDKRTFEMLASGETGGLFQLNGQGLTRYLKELRPTSIHDINAMVALYRPGPMESIPQYIMRKHKPALVEYLDPRLEDILKNSYGVIVYQDDVMLIAIKLAGYSWPEADKLRKAMGKKIPAEMEAQKGKLIAGFIKNGLSKEKAEKLWMLIEPFAAYGFNKAHAASYGKVAYQTAYMKAHFPAIYMSAVLSADSGDVEKIGETVHECKRMGIPVLPPSINESFSGFTVIKSQNSKFEVRSSKQVTISKSEVHGEERDKIRFGLTTIKNFGEGIANSIIAERKRSGVFTSLANFLERVKDRNLNKKSLEALIKSGALDELGERGAMFSNIELLLDCSRESARQVGNQDSLFGLMTDTSTLPRLRLEEAPPAEMAEKLAWEKELLGLYVSGHPLDKFKARLEKRDYTIAKIKGEFGDGMTVVVGGIIEEAKSIITKKNEVMAFVRLADLSAAIEVVVFPRVWNEFKNLFAPEQCVAIKGRFSTRNGTPSIIAEKVKELK